MATLHEFRVFADFPDDISATEAEHEIAAAIDAYLKTKGSNHATMLVGRTQGITVVDMMAAGNHVKG
jgi:hypothetical protein